MLLENEGFFVSARQRTASLYASQEARQHMLLPGVMHRSCTKLFAPLTPLASPSGRRLATRRPLHAIPLAKMLNRNRLLIINSFSTVPGSSWHPWNASRIGLGLPASCVEYLGPDLHGRQHSLHAQEQLYRARAGLSALSIW
jgi:hypothetical protein